MTFYSLPGYYDEKTAQNIKKKMQGRTFYNFQITYGNSCGNCSISVFTDYFDKISSPLDYEGRQRCLRDQFIFAMALDFGKE